MKLVGLRCQIGSAPNNEQVCEVAKAEGAFFTTLHFLRKL
jgi:hypothetical protein